MKTKKKLGQNFLINEDILESLSSRIVSSEYQDIIEIGPGTGNLTKCILAKTNRNIYAIEKDTRMQKCLEKLKAKNSNFDYCIDDILTINISQNFIKEDYIIVGNLPYHISIPILFKTIEINNIVGEAIFMFQREVADRILAKNNKNNLLSLICELYFHREFFLSAEPKDFDPAPKVKSSVIILQPRKKILFDVNVKELKKITSKIFKTKRKKITNCLKSILPEDKIYSYLDILNIDKDKRPEDISLEDYCNLSNYITSQKS